MFSRSKYLSSEGSCQSVLKGLNRGACLGKHPLWKIRRELHFAALAALNRLIFFYSATVTMIRLASPAGEHRSVSEDVSLAERTSRAESTAERNFFPEQRSSRHRPCDACRRRKSRCVLKEGAVKCVLCEFHGQECTFMEKIPPRKRRRASGEDELDR